MKKSSDRDESYLDAGMAAEVEVKLGRVADLRINNSPWKPQKANHHMEVSFGAFKKEIETRNRIILWR